MRGWLVYLFLLSILVSAAFGQGDTELKYLKGGQYSIDFSFSSALFMGVGSRVGGMGGDLGGLMPSSESILWNPANLTFIRNSQLTFDVQPSFMLDPQSLIDLDQEVRSGVDDNIKDLKGKNFVLGNEDYPDFAIKMGEKASLGNGSFAFRNGDLVIAGALFQPLSLNLDLIGSGLETQIETKDEDDPANDVTFYNSIDLNLVTNVNVQGASLGFARRVTPKWGIGASLERLSGSAEVNGKMQVEAIMVLAGNEQAFNDPNDPWDNTLHSFVEGKYQGSAFNYKIGSTYQLSEKWGFGTVLSLNNTLNMKGTMDISLRNLPGLNFGAEEDEDLLDATKIDLDEPTKTILEDNPTSDMLTLKMPSSLGLGFSGKVGFIGLSLNYVQYFGEFSYQYNVPNENGVDHYHNGLKFSNAVRMGIDLKVLRLGAGITNAKMIDTLSSFEKGDQVLLPSFSVGTGFRINRRFSTDLLLVGVPSGVGKVSINYDL